jgi:hypothetical protein
VQRVVVDASGNVGIGTDSPGVLSFKTLNLDGGASGSLFRLSSTNVQASVVANETLGSFNISTETAHPIRFYTTGSERMRIDAGGILMLGTTSTGANAGGLIMYRGTGGAGRIDFSNSSGAAQYSCVFYYGTTPTRVGSIVTNPTNTTYNTGGSDYRLKEEIKPLVSGLEKIQAMKPVSFKWKESQKEDYGFIAHELQAVIPEAVTGEKDAVDAEGNPEYQAIFPAPAQMVASLVAAIQEQQAQIEALKAEVAALKAP